MRSITLNGCMGIGDLVWVYQKFANHVDGINFNIAQLNRKAGDATDAKLQTRATEFLKLLPKVTNVGTVDVSASAYERLAHNYFPMSPIMDLFKQGSDGPFDYACNGPLDNGIRIEDIDKEYSVQTDVPILCTYAPLAFPIGEFITVYVSGSTRFPEVRRLCQLWTEDVWAQFIRLFYDKYKLNNPILIIGASYDREAAVLLEQNLKNYGIRTHTYIDSQAYNITYILKNSVCFIGYQSGLNILADILDVKQIMLYFPKFESGLINSWCKLRNKENGIYNADFFSKTPAQVLDKLTIKL